MTSNCCSSPRQWFQWFQWSSLAGLAIILMVDSSCGFSTPLVTFKCRTSRCCPQQQRQSTLLLFALTERQMQFWEDVDEGLSDIEAFYESSKSMDIDRVRRFAKSASGQLPPPTGSAPGHEPSEEHIDGLTAKPLWDYTHHIDLFPWAAELEAKSPVIIQEWNAYYDNVRNKAAAAARDSSSSSSSYTTTTTTTTTTTDDTTISIIGDSAYQSEIMGPGWSAVRLQRLGVWNAKACRQSFPLTYELLRSLSIPLAVRGVCFARQAPGTGVQPHSDGRNFILTAHLGIDVPSYNDDDVHDDVHEAGRRRCWMKVGTEECTWEVGKLTIIDTSFEHSTGNPGDSERLVLIIDFWHPELTEAERAALEFVYDLRNKFENGKIPFRKPRSLQAKEEGIGAFWSKLTGGS